MDKQIVEFKNIHGTFRLGIGKVYDLDLVDAEGNVEPLSNVKVVSKAGERIWLEDSSEMKFPILTDLIVHETEKEHEHEFMTKMKQVKLNIETGEYQEIDAIGKISFSISSPTYKEPTKITKDDVWGRFDGSKMVGGMVVANGDERCPHFGDTVPYKSATVVCRKEQFEDVAYWLEYVQGANCISNQKEIEGELGLIAVRADYMCW